MNAASPRGPVRWMAENLVAANLLMGVLMVGGLLVATRVRREVFPEIELDIVTIRVPYPGANPDEVEDGIIRVVEEAVVGLDGVETVTAIAAEGVGIVQAELSQEANTQRAFNDVRNAVDRITSFPLDAEEPTVSLPTTRREVLSLILSGAFTRNQLKSYAEQARRALLDDPRITQVEITGVPRKEIHVLIPQESLRELGFTIEEVATRVRTASVELPAGRLKAPEGDVVLRTLEPREWPSRLAELVLLTDPQVGSRVTLGSVATIIDTFEDVDRELTYNGLPAVQLRVYRTGEQGPVDVSEAVAEWLRGAQGSAPEGLNYAIWNDAAETYRSRINLLLGNAALGLVLVLVLLGLFLKGRVAFWVTMGIPASFLGSFLFLQAFDVSINMISLFAFILVLGIVVDDAIVIGEAIYARDPQPGEDRVSAAVAGTREVSTPVVLAVLTTVVAFVPMLFIPGSSGEFFEQIPAVVIPILIISLVESLLVLPAHLIHGGGRPPGRMARGLGKVQALVQAALMRFIDGIYAPALRWLVLRRVLTVTMAVGLLVICMGLLVGGHIRFSFLPDIEGEEVTARLRLPAGTHAGETRALMGRLVEAARQTSSELGEGEVVRGILASLGEWSFEGGPDAPELQSGGHLAQVSVLLQPSDTRTMSAATFTAEWRKKMGTIAGVDSLVYNYKIGPAAGEDINIELSHPQRDVLNRAAEHLAQRLEDYAGVRDVDDGVELGARQFDFTLQPHARLLGLTEQDLARQIRDAFFGAEAVRFQRGRDEIRVYVRLPEHQRDSPVHLRNLILRTPEGGEVPLTAAATIATSRANTRIERRDGRRVLNVTADVDPSVTSAGQVLESVEVNVLPEVKRMFPGLQARRGGEQEDQQESMASLASGTVLALLAMYGAMAALFRRYGQPLIIMLNIPFGAIGALGGHLLMGAGFSLVSVLGLVALSGVVINDSLVLISAINGRCEVGMEPLAAVIDAGKRRFRPILLTTLTTFIGLTPMIFETSVQAKFLTPMAISLGFGVLFTTVVALIVVPCGYLLLEDARRLLRGK